MACPKESYGALVELRDTDLDISYQDMKRCIEWLFQKHFIVEKSKVLDEYLSNECTSHDDIDKETYLHRRDMTNMLERIFGEETFNTDKR